MSRIKPEEDKPKKKKKKKTRKSESKASDDDEEDGDDYEYLFLCNRWLAKNEDDGEIMRELVPSNKSGLKRHNTLSGKVPRNINIYCKYRVLNIILWRFRRSLLLSAVYCLIFI